jgi:hypothetical protein
MGIVNEIDRIRLSQKKPVSYSVEGYKAGTKGPSLTPWLRWKPGKDLSTAGALQDVLFSSSLQRG